MTADHKALAIAWCQWNGQRGTDAQIARLRLSYTDLVRMLAKRGVRIAHAL